MPNENVLQVSFQQHSEARYIIVRSGTSSGKKLEEFPGEDRFIFASDVGDQHPDHESEPWITSDSAAEAKVEEAHDSAESWTRPRPSPTSFPPVCKQLAQRLRNMALAPSSSQMLSPARLPMLTMPDRRPKWLPRLASSVCGVVLAVPNV